MPVIPSLRGLKQEDCQFENSLSYKKLLDLASKTKNKTRYGQQRHGVGMENPSHLRLGSSDSECNAQAGSICLSNVHGKLRGRASHLYSTRSAGESAN